VPGELKSNPDVDRHSKTSEVCERGALHSGYALLRPRIYSLWVDHAAMGV
jgi:hypothetical protein